MAAAAPSLGDVPALHFHLLWAAARASGGSAVRFVRSLDFGMVSELQPADVLALHAHAPHEHRVEFTHALVHALDRSTEKRSWRWLTVPKLRSWLHTHTLPAVRPPPMPKGASPSPIALSPARTGDPGAPCTLDSAWRLEAAQRRAGGQAVDGD